MYDLDLHPAPQWCLDREYLGIGAKQSLLPLVIVGNSNPCVCAARSGLGEPRLLPGAPSLVCTIVNLNSGQINVRTTSIDFIITPRPSRSPYTYAYRCAKEFIINLVGRTEWRATGVVTNHSDPKSSEYWLRLLTSPHVWIAAERRKTRPALEWASRVESRSDHGGQLVVFPIPFWYTPTRSPSRCMHRYPKVSMDSRDEDMVASTAFLQPSMMNHVKPRALWKHAVYVECKPGFSFHDIWALT